MTKSKACPVGKRCVNCIKTQPDRYCDIDHMWVCRHCGRHVEYDRFLFTDESCMLNAVKIEKKLAVYEDDDQNKRVIEVIMENDDVASSNKG